MSIQDADEAQYNQEVESTGMPELKMSDLKGQNLQKDIWNMQRNSEQL